MTGDGTVTNALIYATLQEIQERIAEMDDRLTHGIHRVSAQVSALDSYMAGYHRSDTCQNDEIDNLRGRVEALERKAREAKDDKPAP